LSADRASQKFADTPTVLAIALGSFFSDLGHETATALLPAFLALVLQAPPVALGLIEGVSDLVGSLARVAGGAIAARATNLRAWAASGYATTGIATGLIALIPSWPWLLLIRPLAWAGRGWRGPVRNLLLTLSVPQGQFGRAFGLGRAGDHAGAVAAPLMAIVLLALFSYRPSLLLATVPGLLAAVCYLLVKPVRAPTGTFKLRLGGYPAGFRRLLIAAGAFGCAQFAGSLFTLRAIQLLVPLQGRAAGVSLAILLYFTYNLVASFVAYPVGSLADRTGRRRELLMASCISFAAAAVCLALASASPWMLIPAFLLGGAAMGSVEVAESAIAGDQLPPDQRGAGFGLLAGVNGVGDLVASTLVGALWTISAPSVVFLTAAGLALLGAVLARRI
jgi:MFS family permease